MGDDMKWMKLYKMSRNLQANISSVSQPMQEILPNSPQFTKHWGVLIEVYCQGKIYNGKEKLIEAVNDEGNLKCQMLDFEDKVEMKWTKEEIPGVLHRYEEPTIRKFIEGFNNQKIKYQLILDNCQEFVRQFLTELGIEQAFYKMFSTVKMVVSGAAMWGIKSSASISGLSMGGMAFLGQTLLKSVGSDWTKIVSQNIDFFGTHAIDFLAEIAKTEAGKIYCQGAKEAGKKVVLTGYGEMIEGILNAIKGGFTWWQLLQIPVEIGIRLLLQTEWAKKMGITKLGAYAGSKVASAATAACVGLVGGPAGMLGALTMWFAAEVVTFILRILFGWISSKFAKDKKDYFDQFLGPSQTLELLKLIVGKLPSGKIKDKDC